MTGQENLLCETKNPGGTTATMENCPAASVPATRTSPATRTKAGAGVGTAAVGAAATAMAVPPAGRQASAAPAHGHATRGCAACAHGAATSGPRVPPVGLPGQVERSCGVGPYGGIWPPAVLTCIVTRWLYTR